MNSCHQRIDKDLYLINSSSYKYKKILQNYTSEYMKLNKEPKILE